MEKQPTHRESGEMLLSIRKIRYNLLKYWWICILVMGLAVGYVVLTTWKEYRMDVYSASLDTYQTLATVYIDSKDEDYTDAYKWLLYSEMVRDQVDEELQKNGFEPFDKNQDIIFVATKGDSMYYELTTMSVGLDRTMLIATKFEELLVSEAKRVMGLEGQIIDYPEAKAYMTNHKGAVITFDLDEPKTVSLSLGSLLSWNKLMVLLAGVFVWLGSVLILVLADKVFRTKEEIGAVINLPCICELGRDQKEGWSTGFVTEFVDKIPFDSFDGNYAVVIVGPPPMMKFTGLKAVECGVPEEKIWVSFERKMSCAVGKCGHCRIDEVYVCLDGPVFNYTQAKYLVD